MLTTIDCIPCLVRQTIDVARMVTGDEAVRCRILSRVLVMLSGTDRSLTPPEMTAEIYGVIEELAGPCDPYEEIKQRYNMLALGMLPALRERVNRSPDPFDAAVRLALAGNVIDFGAARSVEPDALEPTVERSLVDPVHGMTTADARSAVDAAGSILYVGDNAGEIVFDLLLVELIGPARVVYAVRGGPVINDVTIDDAREVGMTDLVQVIDTGSAIPGAPPHRCGPAFGEALERADLVIAKGQGNYETLSDISRPVLFLLRAKCPVVARHIGVEQGTMVLEGRNL